VKPLVAIVFASLAAACSASESIEVRSTQRYVSSDGAFSVERPEGWNVKLLNGGLVQFSDGDAAHAKQTIVIRAADKPRELIEGKLTTIGDVIVATERVLRGMPRAKLGVRRDVGRAALLGVRFSLTFVPRGLTRTYRREHAVLMGSDHLFHVIYTSPASEPIDEAAFDHMVSTLTEGA